MEKLTNIFTTGFLGLRKRKAQVADQPSQSSKTSKSAPKKERKMRYAVVWYGNCHCCRSQVLIRTSWFVPGSGKSRFLCPEFEFLTENAKRYKQPPDDWYELEVSSPQESVYFRSFKNAVSYMYPDPGSESSESSESD